MKHYIPLFDQKESKKKQSLLFFVYDLDRILFIDKFTSLADADEYAQRLIERYQSNVIVGEVSVGTETEAA